MEMFKALYILRGSKIRFKCSEGEYEGIIQDVAPTCLTVDHIYFLPERLYMGNLDFGYNEIKSYTVIEPADKIRKYERFDYIADLFSKSFGGTHFNINSHVFNDELDDPQNEEEEILYPEDEKEEEFVLNIPPELERSLPNDSIILDDIDSEFHQAVNYILKQTIIGVSFEGAKISRFGKLSWVCISTSVCVFLFDIEVLESKAFEEGLREVFEKESIEKVIHDCKQPADCLTHLYSTNIVNVFDTQVADYIISKQRYNDKYEFKYVSSLDCCLVNHLEVPQEYLRNRQKSIFYNDELRFFSMRPISSEYRNIMIKNAIYLIMLKEKLGELLFEPFYKTVDVYLKVLSNASDAELLLDVSVPDMIPPAAIMKGVQTVRFQEVPSETCISLKCNFRDPLSGKIIESCDHPSESDLQNSLVKADVAKKTDGKKKISMTSKLGTKHENRIPVVKNNNKDTDVQVLKSHNTKDTHISYMSEKCSKVHFKDKKESEKSSGKNRFLDENSVSKPELKSSGLRKKLVVNEMSIKNSSRQIDRIYYKRINGYVGDSEAPYNIVDVKPSSDYVSTFVQFQTPEITCFGENDISNLHDSSDYASRFENMPRIKSACDMKEDYSDVWAKLRAAFDSSCSVVNEDLKNIQLIPAGMS